MRSFQQYILHFVIKRTSIYVFIYSLVPHLHEAKLPR